MDKNQVLSILKKHLDIEYDESTDYSKGRKHGLLEAYNHAYWLIKKLKT